MATSRSTDACIPKRSIPMMFWSNFVAIVALFALSTAAFQGNHHAKTSVVLHAWSLPNDGSFAFRSWYNEYNPTARVTVYNDPDPIERYSFVSVGSDWPSMMTENFSSPSLDASQHKRRMNPLKRAWRRRALRRIIAAARRS